MAKACGLRLGPRGYEFVLLEGSAKRHKVVASEAGEISLAADPSGTVEVLKDLAKRHDIPKDALRVVIESGQAAFRKVNLPINDDDKIEKVIKFEVESELPQFNIEDVVVDWTRLSSTKDSCSLLTTIVTKEDLQGVLDVCEKAGVEPIEVNADTSAIVNAAAACGALDSEGACLAVFVGEESSSIAVLDGGELRELRSIKQGAMTHIPGPVAQQEEAEPEDESEDDAEEALESVFDEEEFAQEEVTEGEVTGEELFEAAPSSNEQEEQRLQVLARMQRELARSISAARTLRPLERVLVAGYDMPGLIGSEILDVPVEALTGLPDTGSSASRCAAAYGAAVAQLGGGMVSSSLRREELRFTGTLERVELPLAVAGLLLVTLLGVWNIRMGKELDRINDAVRYWRDASVTFMIPGIGKRGNLDPPPATIKQYTDSTTGEIEKNLYRDDELRGRYEQMTYLRTKLKQEIAKLNKDLGHIREMPQPQSALKGVTYVLDVLDDTRAEGARPSLRYVKASYNRGSNTRSDTVMVTLDVTFFAEDSGSGTTHFESFRRKIEAQPWHIKFDPVTTEPLENGGGISIERIKITMDVSMTEDPTS